MNIKLFLSDISIIYKGIIIILFFSNTFISSGQTIAFSGGISECNLNMHVNNVYDDYLEDNHSAPTFFIGISYFERDFFSLNSNIGLVEKGGGSTFPIPDNKRLKYISLNTLARLKYSTDFIEPFVEFGPRIDILYGNENLDDLGNNKNSLNKMPIGGILGCGIKIPLKKIEFGLGGYYSFNFTKLAEWFPNQEYGGEITDNTFLFLFSLGYSISRISE